MKVKELIDVTAACAPKSSYGIGFFDGDALDEVVFIVDSPAELVELFSDFCAECGHAEDSAVYVHPDSDVVEVTCILRVDKNRLASMESSLSMEFGWLAESGITLKEVLR